MVDTVQEQRAALCILFSLSLHDSVDLSVAVLRLTVVF